ncbi:hypothetical protein JKG41_15480 [Acidithiobacillus sp. MC2.1]|nr:hypothetical protein [Acidithiobacillus sp. MC2.2]
MIVEGAVQPQWMTGTALRRDCDAPVARFRVQRRQATALGAYVEDQEEVEALDHELRRAGHLGAFAEHRPGA